MTLDYVGERRIALEYVGGRLVGGGDVGDTLDSFGVRRIALEYVG